MAATDLIAVTGATGAVGSRVARGLAEVLQAPGYADGDAMRAALDGVDTLFLVPAAEARDRGGSARERGRRRAGGGRAADRLPLVLRRRAGRHVHAGPRPLGDGGAHPRDGRRVHYDEAYASRDVFGAPDWEVRGWVTSYLAIRDGSLERVTDAVRELTGRDPRSLAEYLQAQPESLAHVTGASA